MDIIETSEQIRFGELTLYVKPSDMGGKHYHNRTHVEEYVSPAYRFIKANLNPDVCVDIGANYGFTAMLMKKAFPKAKLLLVEPIPWLEDYVRLNFKKNNLRFDRYYSAIASRNDSDEIATFGERVNSTQDSRVVPPPGAKVHETKVTSIDRLLADDARKPAYIKIDTQGWEESVFAGGEKYLRNSPKWLIKTEFGPHWLESQGTKSSEFLRELVSKYMVFECHDRIPWKMKRRVDFFGLPLKPGDVEGFTRYVRSLNRNDQGWVDLYVIPKKWYKELNSKKIFGCFSKVLGD